jgi:hypothetical protein
VRRRWKRARTVEEVRFTELDDLGRLIQGTIKDLEAAGEIEPPVSSGGPGRFNGYCARACIAYDYLVREVAEARRLSRDPDDVVVKTRKEPDAGYGESHYWLVFGDADDARRAILDLNFAPGEKPDKRYPYHDCDVRKATWRRDRKDPKLPNRNDTKKIIEAVKDKLRSRSRYR